ncbi:hypothetical protein VPH35_010688 [Triticum aestivum]|uniref:Disease resistance protein RPM1 n=1 Tax=Triticum turgidum subsp. durum TaxID=4567 RepID=A0A9R0VAT0_TRITD|nr:disease resistance protein RPM1-like [Triticum aestivum]VAH21900.1 unnamed protein product [Triticum turgidum subsp. durum]
MAESLLLALTKVSYYLAEQAGYKLTEEIRKLRDLPSKVGKIERELRMMNAVVRHIDTADTNELLKEWIVDVRKLAYRVEDVMDNFTHHALELEGESFMMRQAKKIYFSKLFSAMASDIIQIDEDIQHVTALRERYVHVDLTQQQMQAPQDELLPQVRFPQFVNDEDLVGMQPYKVPLTQWLQSAEPDGTVITVCGMGGLGKTTLVANVYERAKSEFQAHAWIAVSKTYAPDALLRTLIRSVGEDKQEQLGNDKNIQDLRAVLNKKLKEHNTILVLDDVWDQRVFLDIQDAFKDLETSRVVITTRSDDVASLANPARRLKLQPLESSDASELFRKRAFAKNRDHKCPDHLKELAENIVMRCQGLPLAIVSIGILLSSRKQIKPVWTQVYNQLRYHLAKNDDVRGIINLSYRDLPPELRNCFLYCSMFPQNWYLARRSLVLLWVAEGFAVREDQSTAEEVAEGYLEELIRRNMLQLVETDELGRVNTCKMHDIVRDLALSIARNVRFGATNNSSEAISTMDTEIVRRLSMSGDTYINQKKGLPHLRTLIAHGRSPASSPDAIWPVLLKSKFITVLELQDSNITLVPPSIGDLFNLRYIGLRGTAIKMLPDSIEKLLNLQTLDVKSTGIERLPRGVAKVKNLRHLLADRSDDDKDLEFTCLGVAAPRALSNLEQLQTLETVEASNDLAEQLEKLMRLESLWIDNISANQCAELFAAVSRLPLLSSLSLAASGQDEELSFEALQPTSSKLQRLIVKGLWATATLDCPIFKDHGGNLKYLDMSWCNLGEDTLKELSSYLQNLTHLNLNRVNSAKHLVIPAAVFPLLKTLSLQDMHDVVKLTIEAGAIPTIRALYLRSMPKLGIIPDGIESLDSLKKLWMVGLHPEFSARWKKKDEWRQKVSKIPELRII